MRYILHTDSLDSHIRFDVTNLYIHNCNFGDGFNGWKTYNNNLSVERNGIVKYSNNTGDSEIKLLSQEITGLEPGTYEFSICRLSCSTLYDYLSYNQYATINILKNGVKISNDTINTLSGGSFICDGWSILNWDYANHITRNGRYYANPNDINSVFWFLQKVNSFDVKITFYIESKTDVINIDLGTNCENSTVYFKNVKLQYCP